MRRHAPSTLVALGLLAVVLSACAGPVPSEATSADAMAPRTTPSAAASSGPGPAIATPPPVNEPGPSVEPTIAGAAPPVAPVSHGPFWPVVDASSPGSDLVLHVPILMYHRIVDPVAARCGRPDLCVKPSLFAAQLHALSAAGWRTITVATLASDLARGIRPPTRTFAITLDDGHRDGLTNALPILERYHFVATYFVVTGRLRDSGYLHPADLATLTDAGMEIGDHSVSHRNLQHFDIAGVVAQVDVAAATIRSIVGQRPTSFAYPFGDTNRTVLAGVAVSGVAVALMNRDIGVEDWADRFALPRIEIKGRTGAATVLRTVAAYARRGSFGGA